MAALEPFQSAIDNEYLGQLDVMNFLSESGLAAHAGRCLPSGYMMFPIYDFDPGKPAEADPQGFKDYLKIIGVERKPLDELMKLAMVTILQFGAAAAVA